MDREKIMAELEAGDESAPETSAPQTPAQPETAQPQVTGDSFEYFVGNQASKVPGTAEFAIKHNGQLVRVPASKLVNNYRQSAHLETKLKELSEKYGAYEKSVGPLDAWQKRQEEMGKYEKLQQWSEAHPNEFQELWSGLDRARKGLYTPKAAEEGAPQGGPDFERLNTIINEQAARIEKAEKFMEQYGQEKYEATVASEEKKIDEEVEKFNTKYSKFGLKLDEVDEEGYTLRGRILKHALDNQIHQFEVAAISFLGDTLLDRAQSAARTEAVKGAKGDVAAGIVSRSSIPNGQSAKVDARKMSAEDRRKAALEELTAAEASA